MFIFIWPDGKIFKFSLTPSVCNVKDVYSFGRIPLFRCCFVCSKLWISQKVLFVANNFLRSSYEWAHFHVSLTNSEACSTVFGIINKTTRIAGRYLSCELLRLRISFTDREVKPTCSSINTTCTTKNVWMINSHRQLQPFHSLAREKHGSRKKITLCSFHLTCCS